MQGLTFTFSLVSCIATVSHHVYNTGSHGEIGVRYTTRGIYIISMQKINVKCQILRAAFSGAQIFRSLDFRVFRLC